MRKRLQTPQKTSGSSSDWQASLYLDHYVKEVPPPFSDRKAVQVPKGKGKVVTVLN